MFRCLYEMQCDSHPHRFSLTASRRARSALARGRRPCALRHRVGGPGLRVRYSFEPRPGTEVPNRHAHMRRHRKRSWRPPRTRVPRWTPRAGCSPRPSGRGPWVRAEIRAVLNFLNAGARGISSRSIVVRDPRTAASLREEGEGQGYRRRERWRLTTRRPVVPGNWFLGGPVTYNRIWKITPCADAIARTIQKRARASVPSSVGSRISAR